VPIVYRQAERYELQRQLHGVI